MKRFAITSLSILCLSLATTVSVKAESKIEHLMQSTTITSSNTESPVITPFELVSRGYQGAYQMQGIPGFGPFLANQNNRMVAAEELVKAAIAAHQLPPEIQNDREYLRAVEFQLLGRQN